MKYSHLLIHIQYTQAHKRTGERKWKPTITITINSYSVSYLPHSPILEITIIYNSSQMSIAFSEGINNDTINRFFYFFSFSHFYESKHFGRILSYQMKNTTNCQIFAHTFHIIWRFVCDDNPEWESRCEVTLINNSAAIQTFDGVNRLKFRHVQ